MHPSLPSPPIPGRPPATAAPPPPPPSSTAVSHSRRAPPRLSPSRVATTIRATGRRLPPRNAPLPTASGWRSSFSGRRAVSSEPAPQKPPPRQHRRASARLNQRRCSGGAAPARNYTGAVRRAGRPARRAVRRAGRPARRAVRRAGRPTRRTVRRAGRPARRAVRRAALPGELAAHKQQEMKTGGGAEPSAGQLSPCPCIATQEIGPPRAASAAKQQLGPAELNSELSWLTQLSGR